jgi:predicted ABC-class ATPase
MDYNKARHGQVVNLAEELIRSGKLKELLDELETLRYQDKLRRRLDNEAYAAALAQAGVDGP